MIRLLYQFPEWMQRLYRGVTWRRRGTRVVYLTFDDGPIPEVTPAILDILKTYAVPATFFVVGDNVRKYPQLCARMILDGHRLGNHTMHHLKGNQCSTDDYLRDIEACEQLLRQSGVEDSRPLFRPPYGRMRFCQKREVLKRGYEIVLWDVLTHDYNPNYSPARMLQVVKHYTRDGSIINFHDSVKSGARTIEVLPQVIEWLLAQGYTIGLL